MAASGGYTWNPGIDEIIYDAYERCGIEGSDVSAQLWSSAIFSLNAVLAELTNMQLNLWEVEAILISLQEGVRDYLLPDGTVDLIDVYRRTFTRVPDVSSSATYIDYGSGVTNIITQVGYQSNVTATYNLIWEGSNDGSAWTQLAARGSFLYTKGAIVWDIVKTPGAYRYYRVRDAAALSLDAQEVYFCNDEKDYVLGRMSRQEYDAISTKSQSGIPVAFYTERVINPLVHIYQTPDTQYTIIRATRIRQIQSVTGATQTLDSPFRFIEAVTSMLAAKLAIKRAPDRLSYLVDASKLSVGLAMEEDRERVEAKFVPDMSGYRI